jgi:hypothetical protein
MSLRLLALLLSQATTLTYNHAVNATAEQHYVKPITCCGLPAVNEQVVLTAANQLVSLGLADAGYTYLNLDGEHDRTCSRGADHSSIVLKVSGCPSRPSHGLHLLARHLHTVR